MHLYNCYTSEKSDIFFVPCPNVRLTVPTRLNHYNWLARVQIKPCLDLNSAPVELHNIHSKQWPSSSQYHKSSIALWASIYKHVAICPFYYCTAINAYLQTSYNFLLGTSMNNTHISISDKVYAYMNIENTKGNEEIDMMRWVCLALIDKSNFSKVITSMAAFCL